MSGSTEKMLMQTREIFVRFPELFLVLLFLPILVLCAARFGGLHFPVDGQEQFAFNHYIAPTFLGVGCALLAVGVRSFSSALVIGLLSIFSVIAHFNFKAWIPLVNPTLFDDIYWKLDGELGVRYVALQLRAIIAHCIPFDINPLYHLFFVLCFFVAFIVCALRGGTDEVRSFNFSICCVLLMGGVLYWIAPALGPFIYGESTESQQYMMSVNEQIRETGVIPRGFFIEGLAAMPSLHLAHGTVFVIYMMRVWRPSAAFFIFCWLWFFIESMSSGWHYFVDIPPGILLEFFFRAGVQLVFLVCVG